MRHILEWERKDADQYMAKLDKGAIDVITIDHVGPQPMSFGFVSDEDIITNDYAGSQPMSLGLVSEEVKEEKNNESTEDEDAAEPTALQQLMALQFGPNDAINVVDDDDHIEDVD